MTIKRKLLLYKISTGGNLKFGQEYGLAVGKGKMGGFKVTISIPYKEYINWG